MTAPLRSSKRVFYLLRRKEGKSNPTYIRALILPFLIPPRMPHPCRSLMPHLGYPVAVTVPLRSSKRVLYRLRCKDKSRPTYIRALTLPSLILPRVLHLCRSLIPHLGCPPAVTVPHRSSMRVCYRLRRREDQSRPTYIREVIPSSLIPPRMPLAPLPMSKTRSKRLSKSFAVLRRRILLSSTTGFPRSMNGSHDSSRYSLKRSTNGFSQAGFHRV
jgi:hypothetical protein